MEIAKQRIEQWVAAKNVYKELNLSGLGLTELPEIPPNCIAIDCSVNKLVDISKLIKCLRINCSDNMLKVLPPLIGCYKLNCSLNTLKELPNLPHCKELNCSHNILNDLPDLPKCEILDCSNNKLKQLREMSCGTIICNNNELILLPDFLNCSYLDCSCNRLNKIPYLLRCKYLDFSNNNIFNFAPPEYFYYHYIDDNNDNYHDRCTVKCYNNKYLHVYTKKDYDIDIRRTCGSACFVARLLSTIKDKKNNRRCDEDNLPCRCGYNTSINYGRFAMTIQRNYWKYHRKRICSEILLIYGKNISSVIGQYI